jgi:hypothetical protein
MCLITGWSSVDGVIRPHPRMVEIPLGSLMPNLQVCRKPP